MWSSLIAYRMLLRVRWGVLALLAVSILLILMTSGILASVYNISGYSTEEISKSLPVHYQVTLDLVVLGGDRGKLWELHEELVKARDSLRTGIAEEVNLLVTADIALNITRLPAGVTGVTPTPIPQPPTTVGVVRLPSMPIMGTFYGHPMGVRVEDSSWREDSLGLNVGLRDSQVEVLILGALKGLGVDVSRVYYFECNLGETIPICPTVILPVGVFEGILLSHSNMVSGLKYVYLVNFSLGSLTILSPQSIEEASRGYSMTVFKILEGVVGAKLYDESRVAGGLIRIIAYNVVDVNYRGLSIRVQPSELHLLASTLSAFSAITLLTSAFMFSVALPVIIVSWILARSVGELIAYDVRRFIALSLIRGLSARSFTIAFLAISTTVALAAVALSTPTLRFIVELLSRATIGRVYHAPSPLDLGYLATSLSMALILSILVYLRVRGMIRGFSDLTQASRLYTTVDNRVWRPSGLLTLLFILSLFKYTLWVTGVSVGELIRWASEVHPLLVVLMIFYALLDFLVGFLAPVIVPYYLASLITSRSSIVSIIALVSSRLTGGRWGVLATAMSSRISPRLSSLVATTAITLSFVIAAAIIKASIGEWYNANRAALTGDDFGSRFFNVIALSVMFYSFIAFALLAGFIVVSSLIISYSIFKGLERELAVLKTRGVRLVDLIKLTYSQVLTLTLITLLISPLGIISARGFIETFNSIFSDPLARRGIQPPVMTVDPMGLTVIVTSIALSLITPLILVAYLSRRLSVELVERV